jgi:hypothetical protein
MQVGTKEIRVQLRRIEAEREGFFAGAVVRDQDAAASFAKRIRQLEKLLRPALVIENATVGSLEKAAARGGGSLLGVFNDSLFSAVNGARPLDRQLWPRVSSHADDSRTRSAGCLRDRS